MWLSLNRFLFAYLLNLIHIKFEDSFLFNVLIFFVVCIPLSGKSQEISLNSNTPQIHASNSIITYTNPIQYDVKYIFELHPEINKIKKSEDLKVWIPVPREWESQKNIELVNITPQPYSEYVDPEFGNKFILWNFADFPIKEIYRAEIHYRIQSYGIHTTVDTFNISSYNTNKKEYDLYTRSGYTINLTPEIKELATNIVKGEKNPYLKAKKIYEFVYKNVRYKIDVTVKQDRARDVINMINAALTDDKTGETYYEGNCTHMSALFVALCRSTGIPARCVFGFIGEKIYLEEEQLAQPVFDFEKLLTPAGLSGAQCYGAMGPHMWAEFYLQDIGWIPVDPDAGLFGELYNLKIIKSKGRDILLGQEAPRKHQLGYGAQWIPVKNGRVDFPFYGVWNIGKIRTAKVKIIHVR